MMKLEKSEICRTMRHDDNMKTVLTTEVDTSGKKTVTRVTYINGNESSYEKESNDTEECRRTYIQNLDESGKPDQYQTTISYKTSDGDGYSETIKRYKTGKFSADGRRNWTMGEAVNITSAYETICDLCSHDGKGNVVNARESSRREYYDGDKIVRSITEGDSDGDTLVIEDYEYPVCGCVYRTTRSTEYGTPKCNITKLLSIDVDKLVSISSIAGIRRFLATKSECLYLAYDILVLKGTLTYGNFTFDVNYTYDSSLCGGYYYTLNVINGDYRGSKITIYSYGDSDTIRFDCVTHSEKPEEGDIVDTYTWAIHKPFGEVGVPHPEDIMSSLSSIKAMMVEMLPKDLFEALEIKDTPRMEVLSGATAWTHAVTLHFPNAEVTTTKHYIAVDDGEKENKTETPTTEPAPTPTAESAPKAPNKAKGKVSVKRTTLKKELHKKGGEVTVYKLDYVSDHDLNMASSTRRERS